ncbi:MAG: riboflavin biosynthesis protein RibF [Candidatus Neomarinimicrobiota bacterium]|nr:riboflavin biosynthesis protein RibF [Candidatus Neomarinimicrobiota bacterium]MEC9273238.1 riboflavin biosynthesis protein RibF [Candidatus Neomarinimicrobiota bacterium]
MIIFTQINRVTDCAGCVLTIGSFDGLHRGHQDIVKTLTTTATAKGKKSALITFDPHPRHILDKDKKLSLIMSMKQKSSLLEKLGIDILLVIPFTNDFSLRTAEDFMDNIIMKYFSPSGIVIGYDHHFGYRREGSPEFLQQYAITREINIDIINAVADDKVILSSTHIRDLISNGFVRRASFELGWVYGFYAKVVHGAGRGKGLQFPTANIVALEKNQLMPKTGVYLARGRVNDDFIVGMCNFGTRPTFNERELVMEINFFTSSLDDIYNREIYIEFLERIRDEKKFDNPDQLVIQLQQDRDYCLELKKKYE